MKKTLMLFIILASFLVIAHSPQVRAEDEKTELYNVINEYYFSFLEENMDRYLNTQILVQLSPEELTAKKALIKQMWEKYQAGFLLPGQEEMSFTIDGTTAIVEYELHSNLMDNDGTTIKEDTVNMTAICFKTKEGWKIFNIVPSSVYEFNIAADMAKVAGKKEIKETTEEKDNQQAMITDCEYDNIDEKKILKEWNLTKIPSIVIGKGKIRVHVWGKKPKTWSKDYYFTIKDKKAVPDKKGSENYLMEIDSCTLEKALNGEDPMELYHNGKIRIRGTTIGSKIRTTFAKMALNVASWLARMRKT